jgi:hypothetical protein
MMMDSIGSRLRYLQVVNQSRLKYIAEELTNLVLLTGSPSRLAHWAKCMQWHRCRMRSSIGCWSS